MLGGSLYIFLSSQSEHCSDTGPNLVPIPELKTKAQRDQVTNWRQSGIQARTGLELLFPDS